MKKVKGTKALKHMRVDYLTTTFHITEIEAIALKRQQEIEVDDNIGKKLTAAGFAEAKQKENIDEIVVKKEQKKMLAEIPPPNKDIEKENKNINNNIRS